MAFLSVDPSGKINQRRKSTKRGKAPRQKKGIVYILKMFLGDKENQQCVYKIGITARRVRPLETRISEICTDHFMKYRYFPYVDPRKFKQTEYYFEVESYFHRLFKEQRYYSETKFDGSTELFTITDEKALLDHYELVMANPLEYITPNIPKEVKPTKVEDTSDDLFDDSINNIEPEVFI